MDDLRMANLERLMLEINHFLSGAKDSGVLPAEDRDAAWMLRVDKDRLSAWLETYPSVGNGASLDADEIITSIEESGVRFLDREKVRAIVAQCNNGKDVTGDDSLVAARTPPVNPSEGRIDFLVPFDKVRLVDETDERAIDWKNIWSIPVVHGGDIVARVHSPREGTEGVDIYGAPLLPPSPAPFRVKFGEGVIVGEEDGVTEVLTARDVGQPILRNG